MKRILVGILAAVFVMGSGSVAEARPTRVPAAPIKVVIDSPFGFYRTAVRTNTTTYDQHYVSTWIQYPSGRMLFSGEGRSSKADVPVSGQVQARFMDNVWGLMEGVAVDDVDGRSVAISYDVRRRTKVALTARSAAGSTASLAVRVTHYDAVTDGYINSRRSPVRLQELVGGKWVTRKTVTTDASGRVTALVAAATGQHRYRAYRPDGATVWRAVSPSRIVVK